MVSIWMLCASRTPGSERHKALQAAPDPAPLGALQPGRIGKRSALRSPARPAGKPTTGESELQGENPAARRCGQKPLPRQEGCLPGQARGSGRFCTTNPT